MCEIASLSAQKSVCKMYWRPVFLAVWVGLGMLNSSAAEVEDSVPIGRLCCKEDQILTDNGCVVGKSAGTFSPPISANLSQITVSWTFEPLTCRTGYYVNHLILNESNNMLDIEEGKIYLEWMEVIVLKRSSDFCVGRATDGGYAARTCHPNIDKVSRGVSLLVSLFSFCFRGCEVKRVCVTSTEMNTHTHTQI